MKHKTKLAVGWEEWVVAAGLVIVITAMFFILVISLDEGTSTPHRLEEVR